MKISAVIPAYNEEGRIGNVLSILIDFPFIQEIIVVNDGSRDETLKEVKKYPVHVINFSSNKGKGAAMKRGIEESNGEWILFLDADLEGLKKEHLMSMIQYTKDEDIGMIVGTFTKGNLITDLSHKIAPFLSGQRLIRRSIADKILFLEDTRYGAELMITEYVHKIDCKVKKVIMPRVHHIPKEKKRGWIKGKIEKYSMYRNIIAVFFALYCLPKLKSMKSFHKYSS